MQDLSIIIYCYLLLSFFGSSRFELRALHLPPWYSPLNPYSQALFALGIFQKGSCFYVWISLESDPPISACCLAGMTGAPPVTSSCGLFAWLASNCDPPNHCLPNKQLSTLHPWVIWLSYCVLFGLCIITLVVRIRCVFARINPAKWVEDMTRSF
jgi:hypothetical protein